MLLDVRDLRVEFRTRDGVSRAVNGVSYTVDAGETLAVLGESGSGKSVTAQAVMGILDMPPGRITGGEILFRGRDLLRMKEEERRRLRGAGMAMIFQDALSALNPVLSVGDQLGELFVVHRGMSRKAARAKAVELMERVRIPGAAQRVRDYPHQFSGGMRQRIMIAMALALEPALVIADEPTTALDVTVQAQVMDLLAELRREYRMGLVLITHDLGVVADVADRIAVMYAGRIVESAPVRDIYKAPAHPYTRGLLDSVPRLDLKGRELYAIKGQPPNLSRIPPGCSFHPRCPMARDVCRTDVPPLYEVSGDRGSACHFWRECLDGGEQ
ncbi:ABC transporter ATP-binding protein [Streptomyces sp. MB22_4]|uniref:ABC transporter ATP-binding protein n=1 Tax=Streptomyces sp. MB22_4 TaxID=3383120 RepID=UPI0039A18F14